MRMAPTRSVRELYQGLPVRKVRWPTMDIQCTHDLIAGRKGIIECKTLILCALPMTPPYYQWPPHWKKFFFSEVDHRSTMCLSDHVFYRPSACGLDKILPDDVSGCSQQLDMPCNPLLSTRNTLGTPPHYMTSVSSQIQTLTLPCTNIQTEEGRLL